MSSLRLDWLLCARSSPALPAASEQQLRTGSSRKAGRSSRPVAPTATSHYPTTSSSRRAFGRRAGRARPRRPRSGRRVHAQARRGGHRGGLGRCVRGDRQGELLPGPGRRAALARESRAHRLHRGRRRLPAVAVVCRAQRGQGGAGDAHPRARARAGARHTCVRSRAGPGRGRAEVRRNAAQPRPCSAGSGGPRMLPTRSSTWPALGTPRGRAWWSTEDGSYNPAAAESRSTT